MNMLAETAGVSQKGAKMDRNDSIQDTGVCPVFSESTPGIMRIGG
jgi:hypothetical protein